MNEVITGGLLAIGGALASQATGLWGLVSAGRQRKRESAHRQAADLEATRRPLYEELISAANQARIFSAQMRDACALMDRSDPALGAFAEELPARLDRLLSAAVSVRIDGSDQAAKAGWRIMQDLASVMQAWKSASELSDLEGLDLVATRLADLVAHLADEEENLIDIARQDFGPAR